MYLRMVLKSIHIIDLEQTIPMMRRALTFVRHVCDKRGKICFPALFPLGQLLRRGVNTRAKGKGIIMNSRSRREAQQFIPEALLLLSIKQNLPLLRNSIKLQIPIIAIVNSDADPLGIQYPIPANDNLGLYKDLVLGAIYDSAQGEPKLACFR